jgi:hypothetical protein
MRRMPSHAGGHEQCLLPVWYMWMVWVAIDKVEHAALSRIPKAFAIHVCRRCSTSGHD